MAQSVKLQRYWLDSGNSGFIPDEGKIFYSNPERQPGSVDNLASYAAFSERSVTKVQVAGTEANI